MYIDVYVNRKMYFSRRFLLKLGRIIILNSMRGNTKIIYTSKSPPNKKGDI